MTERLVQYKCLSDTHSPHAFRHELRHEMKIMWICLSNSESGFVSLMPYPCNAFSLLSKKQNTHRQIVYNGVCQWVIYRTKFGLFLEPFLLGEALENKPVC